MMQRVFASMIASCLSGCCCGEWPSDGDSLGESEVRRMLPELERQVDEILDGCAERDRQLVTVLSTQSPSIPLDVSRAPTRQTLCRVADGEDGMPYDPAFPWGTVLAVVGADGRIAASVIARNGPCEANTEDELAGADLAAHSTVVRRALDGEVDSPAMETIDFSMGDPAHDPAPVVVFAASIREAERSVGASVVLLSLETLALHVTGVFMEASAEDPFFDPTADLRDVVFYDLRGFHGGTDYASDGSIVAVLPSAATCVAEHRRQRDDLLVATVERGGFEYAYCLLPVPRLGPDVGALLVWSDGGRESMRPN